MATLGAALQDTLRAFLAPLADGAGDARALGDWLARLGQTQAAAQDPALLAIAQDAGRLADAVGAFSEQDLESWSGIAALLKAGRDAGQLMAALRAFAEEPAHATAAAGLAEEMMALLLASFLRRRHPLLFRLACLFTLIAPAETATPDAPIVDADDRTLRHARVLDRFAFERLGELLQRPGETLAASYLPNGMAAGADAWLAAERLFPSLAFLADLLGLSWRVQHRSLAPPPPTAPTDDDDDEGPDASERVLFDPPAPASREPLPDSFYAASHPTFRVVLARTDAGELAVDVAASSLQHPDGVAGFIVTPAGELSLSETRGGWTFAITATGAVPAFVAGVDGVAPAALTQPLAAGAATLTVGRDAVAGAPAFVFGDAAGSRVELGSLRFSIAASHDGDDGTVEIAADATSGALVLAADDGLLGRLLPEDGLRVPFDLGLVYSSARGFSFRGGAGLETTVPARVELGPAAIDAIRVSLTVGGDGVVARAVCALGVSFGPVHLIADGLGIEASLRFPAEGGNLGPAELDAGFAPPTGFGLAVDATVVSGGGFLRYEAPTRRYSGEIALAVAERWALHGVAIVGPTASGATSVLALATLQLPAESPSFNVTGIGLLVGTHRRGDRDAFARGMANGDIAAILFPDDPIAQAPVILGALDRLFPLSEGSHLIGLLLALNYGGRSRLIEGQLGIIAELSPQGGFSHVYLLFRGHLGLRGDLAEFLSIEVDGFGLWDIGAGEFELRMALRDSKLLGGDLMGEGLVLYYRVPGGDAPAGGGLVDTRPGRKQAFVSLGGYHPDYHPPARALVGQRLSLVITRGDWLRFEVSQYIALSPGAFHFGLDAQLKISLAGFGLHGHIGFDALIGFDWTFDIAFHASLTLELAGQTFASASVDARLVGPGPTILKGKASVSLLWWDVSKTFNREIGGGSAVTDAVVDIAGLLRTAVTQPQSWPLGPVEGVALVDRPRADRVWASPGEPLRMQQEVVPLGLPVDRFGPARLAAPVTLEIDQVVVADAPPLPQAVARGPFASALFFELDDEAKLAAVGFEDYAAGFEVAGDRLALGGETRSTGEYDELVIDSTRPSPPPRRGLFGEHLWPLATALAGAARAEPAPAPRPLVTVGPRRFAVVDADGAALPGLGRVTWAAARAGGGGLGSQLVRADETRGP